MGFVCLLPPECHSSDEQRQPGARRPEPPPSNMAAPGTTSALASRAAHRRTTRPSPRSSPAPRCRPRRRRCHSLGRPGRGGGSRGRALWRWWGTCSKKLREGLSPLSAKVRGTPARGLRVPAGSILCRAAGREGRAGPRGGAESSQAAAAAGGRSPSGRWTSGIRRGLEVRGGSSASCERAVSVLRGSRGSAERWGRRRLYRRGKRPTTSDGRSRMSSSFFVFQILVSAAELEPREL